MCIPNSTLYVYTLMYVISHLSGDILQFFPLHYCMLPIVYQLVVYLCKCYTRRDVEMLGKNGTQLSFPFLSISFLSLEDLIVLYCIVLYCIFALNKAWTCFDLLSFPPFFTLYLLRLTKKSTLSPSLFLFCFCTFSFYFLLPLSLSPLYFLLSFP